MYVPAHFALSDADIASILATMGAGDLVTVHEDGPDATYLPFHYDPEPGEGAPHGSLLTHVARNNRQWIEPCVAPSLVIVHAGDHYVSPSDLPGHDDARPIVPTWDYITVQAYGTLVVHDDVEWLRAQVNEITDRHEAAIGASWRVDDSPAQYVNRMIRAIVGLELRIERWVGKAKMSQNKTPADVEAEIAALDRAAARGHTTLSDLADFKRRVSLPHSIARKQTLADLEGRRPSSLG